MAVVYETVGEGDASNQPKIALTPGTIAWNHTVAGAQAAVLVGLSYTVYNAELSDLTRTVKYDGEEMDSLGAVPWNNVDDGFTEVFGLLNPPSGKSKITAVVSGEPLHARAVRGSSVSYTGVDSFGTAATVYGTGTALAQSTTASAAAKIVQAFGAASGLTAFTRSQRYLNNTHVALLLGDADGTGSSLAAAATKAVTGPWSGVSVILNPADIVGSAKPTIVTPSARAVGRRLARPGITRREVFVA